MVNIWYDLVDDGVEFTWTSDGPERNYAIVLKGEDDYSMTRVTTECTYIFTLEELPVGHTFKATICVIEEKEQRLLYPTITCLIGGVRVVRNVHAKVNPRNVVRMIDITFEKPLMAGVTAYTVAAQPKTGGKVRHETTTRTTLTMPYLKSNTEYVIKVQPIYDDDEKKEIPVSCSYPVRTFPKNRGTPTRQSMIEIQGASGTTVNMGKVNMSATIVEAAANNVVSSEVRSLQAYVVRDDRPNMIKAQWDLPLFSGRRDDYRISHYLVEIFVVDGIKLPSVIVHHEENRSSYETEEIALDFGRKYRITVKTFYEDIDEESEEVSNQAETTKDMIGASSGTSRRTDATMASFDSGEQNLQGYSQRKRPKMDDAALQARKKWDLDKDWILEEKISSGLFGKMYRVVSRTNRAVERAMLKTDVANLSEQDRDILRTDLATFTGLNHERLLCCFGFQEAQTTFYIFNELALWQKLRCRLKRQGVLDEQLSSRITFQILDGLSFMHEKRLIHGDIRSKSILISKQDEIKISGYLPGKKMAWALSSSSHSLPVSTNFLTPEEVGGMALTTKLDIWGVGCTVVEMVTDLKPWHSATSPADILLSVATPSVPPLPRNLNVTSALMDFLSAIFVEAELRPSAVSLMAYQWLDPQRAGIRGVAADAGENLQEVAIPENREELPARESRPQFSGDPKEFEKGETLGSGYYGYVFAATRKKTGVRYAIKKLRPTNMADTYLRREVELSRTLDHPNLVACYGHYIKLNSSREQRYYLIMELMEENLRKKAERKKGLHEDEAKEYTKQILGGLQYLHMNGFVHRDIKGANILLKSPDQVKIADYGFLKKLKNQQASQAPTCPSKANIGTVFWMSPEIARNERFTKNTDIWSLGCTVVEMITTQPPLHEKGIGQCFSILIEPRPNIPILVGRGDVSQGLRDFLKKIFVPMEERPYAHQLASRNPWF